MNSNDAMPTPAEVAYGFGRIHGEVFKAAEAIREFGEAVGRATGCTTIFLADVRALDALQRKMNRLRAQMRAKAHGRKWRTVR
jgi:hypothetical protein